jgi:rod shape-determining protein MreC
MSSGTDRSLSRRDNLLFFACVGLSVGALLMPPAVSDYIAATIRQTALRPFLWIQTRAEESRSSRAVLARLEAERDSAAYSAQLLPALRTENQRLRELLRLSAAVKLSYVGAEVLHQSLPTDGRTLLLSAGSSSGVKEFDPVISPEGLIGVVRVVDANRSIAMTWSHPDFRASAYATPGEVFGIVAPAVPLSGSELLLQLQGVAYRDSIPNGTMVVTSGLGGVYPAGIPVGTVIGQGQENIGWERIYIVRPAANPEQVTHVLILRGPGSSSLAPAFQRDSVQHPPTPVDSTPAAAKP